MAIITGALITAAAGAGSAAASAHGAHKANRTNLRLQREQQAWEKMMSDTAVQRRRWDIERAGGNPALAFTQGQEASTPSIQPAHMENELADAANIIANTGEHLAQSRMRRAQILQASANTRLTTEQAKLARAQAVNTQADTMLKMSTGTKVQQETRNLEQVNREIGTRIEGMLQQNKIRAIQAYVAEHTRDDSIKAIRSGAILQELNIQPAGLKSDWATIKRILLNIVDPTIKD